MTPLAVSAIAVLLALPVIAFMGRTLRWSLVLQMSIYAIALIVSRQVTGLDRYLATVALLVAQLALFSFFLATAPALEVRWSANRAALMALLLYALMIPAMLRTAIDGDEPFYLVVTESIVHDRDLDLSNQYRDLAHSAIGRTDLQPQPGDPVGPKGQQYSRHEPLLALLLVPGYLMAGLIGALATIALFGALLVRSTVRMFEDEGIDDATTRAVFPFFAFAPPILFYAARIWPEVPGAFFFVEAVRGVRQRRLQRWIPALFGLTLLKLRFILIAIPLLLRTVRGRRQALVAALAVGIPLLVVWLISGSATNVHSWRELLPVEPRLYAIGLFGLIVDGAAGILFQAPFYLIGILALVRWRETPAAFRLGAFSSLLYILYLIPRSEWHGGWSPPLRYIVVFAPIFALGAASVWRSINGGVIALIAIWTAGLVVHGVAFPYRLFHIANGENAAGEALSRIYHSDFSRLFPSFIRPNQAAMMAGASFVVLLVAFAFIDRVRVPSQLVISLAAAAIAAMFVAGQQPGVVVQFEDEHVVHQGGELYPNQYAVARFFYRGGWALHANEGLSFLSRGGPARLDYNAPRPALIDLGGRLYQLGP
ncbi:MAG: hypothetical protein ACXW2Q_04440, partial [Thermoanaerobaculia bacterium]